MANLDALMSQTAFPSNKRARVDAAAEDRLSNLPDCLLHDILSRLQSRQAVQTSTLSRRWRHVWRSLPYIDIDQRQFPGSDEPGSRQRTRFEDFADGILAFADTMLPLYAFHLHLVDGRSASSERWIRRALSRRPAIVDIHCNHADNSGIVKWPPSHLDMGAVACRLTILRLYGVTLRYGFGEQLGVQCPVLEVMCIYGCHHQSYFTIASPKLKSLTVICRTSYYYPVTLAITAPRLVSLSLVIPFSGTGSNPEITAPGHEPLPSLVTATIIIYDQGRPTKRANKTRLEFLRSMCGFLARISNVSILKLVGFTTPALLDQKSLEFPVFQNLRTLLLHGCDVGATTNSPVLTRILDGTPNLERIGLHHCKFSGRPRGRARKTGPKRNSSKQRVSALVQHKNLRSIGIKYHPNDHIHWKKVFGTKKMQQWRPVKSFYSVVPSISLNMRLRGDVSTAAPIQHVHEITLGLGRLPVIMRDRVAPTRRVRRRRVTKTASPPTRTDSQIPPGLNPTDVR